MTSPMKLPAAFLEALIGASEDVGADLLTIDTDANGIDLAATFIGPQDMSRTHVGMTISFGGPMLTGTYHLTMVRAHVAACLNQQLGALVTFEEDEP